MGVIRPTTIAKIVATPQKLQGKFQREIHGNSSAKNDADAQPRSQRTTSFFAIFSARLSTEIRASFCTGLHVSGSPAGAWTPASFETLEISGPIKSTG
ncbi:hypothetical protein [Burkholderia pseudomallei]|uniref:hypothetical protein n=1 Tax=Burkholderia pseudomallei TaxID=28450 RepID=UPI0011C4D2F9|nr:hypothetical protein [Burkholderia pseudomallei]